MKRRLTIGSLAMLGAMTLAPVASQAGGSHHRCPLEWLRHRHVAPVAAPAPAKAKKPMKVAAKPMKPMK